MTFPDECQLHNWIYQGISSTLRDETTGEMPVPPAIHI